MNKIKIYVDQGVNQKRLRTLRAKYEAGVDLVNVNHYEQRIKCARSISGVLTLGGSALDGDDYLGDDCILKQIEVAMFPDGKNKPNDNLDIAHLYSTYIEKCDYFVTNNPRNFIYSGIRKRIERILPRLKIVDIDELERLLAVDNKKVDE